MPIHSCNSAEQCKKIELGMYGLLKVKLEAHSKLACSKVLSMIEIMNYESQDSYQTRSLLYSAILN